MTEKYRKSTFSSWIRMLLKLMVIFQIGMTSERQIEMNGSSLATGMRSILLIIADVFGVEVARIAWTDEGLYFGFKVRDNKPDYASVLDFWNVLTATRICAFPSINLSEVRLLPKVKPPAQVGANAIPRRAQP